MASTQETGIAKNIANFKKFINILREFGTKYDPSNSRIGLDNLAGISAAAGKAVTDLGDTEKRLVDARGKRAIAFKPLGTLSTAVLNALGATEGVTPAILKNAQAINRKIQGAVSAETLQKRKKEEEAKAGTTADAAGESSDPVSVSQQSFVSQADHLQDLIGTLSQVPSYAPSEPGQRIAALTDLHKTLADHNTKVSDLEDSYDKQKIARDRSINDDLIGVISIAKKEVASIYGKTSTEYKLLTALKFRKI